MITKMKNGRYIMEATCRSNDARGFNIEGLSWCPLC